MGAVKDYRGKPKAKPTWLRSFADEVASFLIYALLLAVANASFAAPTNVDNEYKDAQKLFEKRDFASRQKAIAVLEQAIASDPNHLETQALLGFAYAHEACLRQQLGEQPKDYLASAEAFAKVVLARQANNAIAKKTLMLLHIVRGAPQEAAKLMGNEPSATETDPDIWYLRAVLSEGDNSLKALAKALELKPDHVWIYSDLTIRAIRLNNLAVAEKWVAALEARAPGIADIDLLKAMVAAQKKNKKEAQQHWSAFVKKVPDSPIKDLLLSRVGQASP